MRSLLIFLLSIFFADLLCAGDKSGYLAAEIESVLAPYSRKGKPGYAMAVLNGDEKPIYFFSGLSNVEHQVPVDNETVFDIGSVSKTFTGYATALLIEDNKLGLSDRIKKYIPELPDRYGEIRIKHLLHHTSGLWDWGDALAISGYVVHEEIIENDRVLSLLIENDARNFYPEEQYNYSNTNYTILGEIISRVSGKPFENHMKSTIFEPLNMASARIARKGLSVKGLATSYKEVKGAFVPHSYGFAAQGSSSALMSIDDFAKWLNNYHNVSLGNHSTHELTQKKSLLKNGKESNYGFGLSIVESDRKHIRHSGGWKAYLSEFRHYPKEELSLAIFCNFNCSTHKYIDAVTDLVFTKIDQPNTLELDKKEKNIQLLSDTSKNITFDLDGFVGDYKVMPGWFMSIDEIGGKLTARHRHYLEFETKLQVIDSKTLFVDGQNATIKFNHGSISNIIWEDAAGSLVLTKLNRHVSNERDYQDYTGTYVNESLNTVYKVVSEKNILTVKHAAHGEDQLTPFNFEYFLGEGKFIVECKFEFDNSGNVLGLSLSSPRVSSIYFHKVKI